MAPQLWHWPPELRDAVHAVATGKMTTAAILDTGFTQHSHLPSPIASRSFIDGETVDDGNGHGNHVTGICVGRKGLGVAPEASLIVAKVLSNAGVGGDDGITKAIYWAVEEGADVISMSLGGPERHPETEDAIIHAWRQGVYVNAAAGNSGFNGYTNTIGNPAKFAECISQGATRKDGSIAGFSSGGPQMDWACPGQNIVSCSNSGNGFVSGSGTSQACPMGSGLLLLIKELQLRTGGAPWTHIDEFRHFISMNVDDRGRPGHDPSFGFGVPLFTQIVDKLARNDLQWV